MTAVTVTTDTAPGPGARVARSAGQLGATDIALRLVTSFGWFGSSHWTGDQAASVALAAAFAVAGLHNLVNWWRNRPAKQIPEAVTVKAVDAQPSAAPAKKVAAKK